MMITVKTPVHLTENREKVKMAMLKIFPDLKIFEEKNELIGRGVSLEKFAEKLKKQKIRDTAKMILLKNMGKNKFYFSLNKQAAFMGKVNFVEESHPLGNIEVVVEDENIQELVKNVVGAP